MFSCFKNLELYALNGKNVMLSGAAGVGKTAYVKTLFDKLFPGEWKYFSSSTLDVFIDFLGIPKDVLDDDNCHIIEYIKPKWHRMNMKALFLDEFNRSPKKMRNAVMEMLQFKTLNGEKFGNLQTVFAAVNPEDDIEYSDVEKLDKAQVDRFECHINVPYMLDLEYFESIYGKDITSGSAEWWNSLDEGIRKKVSPRRLQYAIDIFNIGGSLDEVLPKESNYGKLLDNLKLGSLGDRVEKLFDLDDDEKIKKEFNPNIRTYIKKKLGDQKYVEKFAHLLDDEDLMKSAPENFAMCDYINKNRNKFNMSILGTLDGLGLFKESDFKGVFAIMKQHFVDNKYYAKRRIHIKKLFATLPDMNAAKIRTGDVAQLQNMVNIIGEYSQVSQYQTPQDDDKDYGFIGKMSDLWEMSDKLSLGIDFNSHVSWNLRNLIQRHRNDKMAAQNAAGATFSAQTGQPVVGNSGGGAVIMTPDPNNPGSTAFVDANGNTIGTAVDPALANTSVTVSI